MVLRTILVLTVILGASKSLSAQTTVAADDKINPLRPVNASYMFEAGSAHLADTYLSPLKYTGWRAAFNYERLQAMKFSPNHWRQKLNIGLDFLHADNPAKNANMMSANFMASWGMLYQWPITRQWFLAAGAEVALNLGGVLSSRNGNNPGNAHISATVDAVAYTGYTFHVKRLPILARWQTSLSLTGAFFVPDYDELYYEMYLGNRSHLAHCAWPGNFFHFKNLITTDLDLSATRLRLGFRCDILSTKANNLVCRNITYSFIIGVTGDWISLSHRKPLSQNADIKWVY